MKTIAHRRQTRLGEVAFVENRFRKSGCRKIGADQRAAQQSRSSQQRALKARPLERALHEVHAGEIGIQKRRCLKPRFGSKRFRHLAAIKRNIRAAAHKQAHLFHPTFIQTDAREIAGGEDGVGKIARVQAAVLQVALDGVAMRQAGLAGVAGDKRTLCQHCAIERRAREIRAVKIDHRQLRVAETAAGKIAPRQIDHLNDHVVEHRARDRSLERLSRRERREYRESFLSVEHILRHDILAIETSAFDIRPLMRCPFERCLPEPGLEEIRAIEAGVCQIRAVKCGSQQIGI